MSGPLLGPLAAVQLQCNLRSSWLTVCCLAFASPSLLGRAGMSSSRTSQRCCGPRWRWAPVEMPGARSLHNLNRMNRNRQLGLMSLVQYSWHSLQGSLAVLGR